MGESVLPCQNHGEPSPPMDAVPQDAETAVSVDESPSCDNEEGAIANLPKFIIGDGTECAPEECVTPDSVPTAGLTAVIAPAVGQTTPNVGHHAPVDQSATLPQYCDDHDGPLPFSGMALTSVSASVSSPALQLKATEKMAVIPAAMLISASTCHGDGHMVAVPVVVQSPAGLIHSPSAAGLGSNANLPTAFSPLALSESKASCISDSCSLILPPARLVALDQKSETNSSLMPICRICHMPEDETEILISPCRCSGSLKFIHNTCLMVSDYSTSVVNCLYWVPKSHEILMFVSENIQWFHCFGQTKSTIN